MMDIVFSGNEGLSLLIPFAFTDNAIGLELSRKGGQTQNLSKTDLLYTNGNYINDGSELLQQQNRHIWFYNSIPIYEMFDSSLAQKISGRYSAKYELKYNRKLSNSFKDIYIPSAFNISISRDVNNQSEIKSDLYQIKAVLSNTSINNFGKNSSKKIFNWFEQEELFSTITGLVKIPNSNDSSLDNTKFQISTYLQLLFLIKEKTTLSTAFDFAIDNDINWSSKGIFVYERPSSACLFSLIIDFFLPKFKHLTTEIKRKDSVNIEFEKAAEVFTQKYSYSHFAEMTIKEHYSINGEMGLMYSNNTKTADQLSINLSLGAKAEF